MTSLPDNFLSGLSDRQRDAVTHIDGPLLIIAGPGSGKTRVMAHRVAYLIGITGVSPSKILAVTFTNKAARELRERCERLVGTGSNELQVRTFHGFCARVLRSDGENVGMKPDFTIYDTDDQARVIRGILADIDIDPKQFPPRPILGVISDAKNNLQTPEQFAKRTETYRDEVISRIYEAYETRLHKANSVDFDDLLLKTYRLLEGHPEILENYQKQFEHLLVDEFQDTNPLQFQVARLLAIKSRNICVVGDPDQSIYSWRHADPSNLTDFQNTFNETKIVTLDQSYRSTQIILEAADSVIGNNGERMEKTLWTENDKGSRITVAQAYNEEEEARLVLEAVAELQDKHGIERNEIAVMYRVNAQSKAFELACAKADIPYRLVGGVKFYARKEVKDVISFLRVVANDEDDAALERIINVPARGMSPRIVTELRRVALVNNVSILEVIKDIIRVKGDDEEPARFVTTLNKTRELNSIATFGDLIISLIEQSHLDITELIELVLERSGYGAWLKEKDKKDDGERMENLQRLWDSVEEFSGSDERVQLTNFLENVALVSDVDGLQGGDAGKNDGDAITLITLHQAKGLEYDAVFLVGLEEGMLPHSRSLKDSAQLEEERRLLYVGMTRARKRLYMFWVFQRMQWRDSQDSEEDKGWSRAQEPSQFLPEIPESLVTIRHVRGHSRIADRITDPMWTKRAASTPAPRPARRSVDEFVTNDKVHHNSFGEGRVVSSEDSGRDALIKVTFEGKGIKTIIASHLEIIVGESPDSNGDEPIIQDPDFFSP